MQENNQASTPLPTSSQSQVISNPLPEPKYLTPEMVQAEMKAQGLNTAALFNKQPVQPVNPQELANQEAIARAKAAGEQQAQEPTAPAATPQASKPIAAPTFFDEAKDEQASNPLHEAAPETAEEPEEAELSEASIENFKKLKTNYKETKRTAKELAAKTKELEERLQTYVPPEALQEKENRIAELSKYEKIHNLKTSPEYAEQYIRPLEAKEAKLKEILKDYGVAPEDLDSAIKHAVSINNHAELNSFLSDNFNDQLGASEVKGLITDIKGLRNAARQAEDKPAEMLQSLQESNRQLREAKETQRRKKISDIARTSWQETIMDIINEGQIKELIPVEDDPEFNENYPYKLTRTAATEFGKLVTELGKIEGVELTKETVKALAKMTALSQVAGVSIVTRNRAMDNAEQIERNAERTSGLYRPNVGGGSGLRAPVDQGATKPVDPESQLKSDVGSLVNSVLSKR